MTFSADMGKFTNKAEKAMEKVFRGTALSLFSRIVIRTPVDTGRLRNNWQVSLRGFPSGELYSPINPSGTIDQAELGDTIYISNNLPYAGVIENGSSDQAPQGMMRITIVEFQSIVDANAKKARR